MDKKIRTMLIVVGMAFAIAGCGTSDKQNNSSITKDNTQQSQADTQQSQADTQQSQTDTQQSQADTQQSKKDELPIYSNLADKETQQLFKETLVSAGASEENAQKSLDIVKNYNETIENTSLIDKGYKPFDMKMPEYDIDKIQQLWMDKSPMFNGYNCRITAFELMKDKISIEDTSKKNTEYLFMDQSSLEAEKLFDEADTDDFEALFSEIKTDSSTDTDKQVQVQQKYWQDIGVKFEDSKMSLITVYLHSHIDDNDNSLIVGHTGVLVDEGQKLLFFEKLSFELPYQVIEFSDRSQLKQYLMNCYDVDTTGECAKPFILENTKLLD